MFYNFNKFTLKNPALVPGATLSPPPFAQFYCILNHPKAGELLMYCSLQSSVVPVNIPINFRSRAKYSAACNG
jgi:hypothetical protein